MRPELLPTPFSLRTLLALPALRAMRPEPLPPLLALRALRAIAVALVASTVACSPASPTPDRVETVGNLEIVTRTVQYLSGWNQGDLRRATTETYALRFRGEPLPIEGKAGMWGDRTQVYETVNSVASFAAAAPALLVNVGDPNNASFFYLVREQSGHPVIEYLCETSGGVIAIEPLDADFLDPELLDPGTLEPGPLDTELLDTGPGDTEPLDTEPLDSDPNASEPNAPEPLDTEPTTTEPAEDLASYRRHFESGSLFLLGWHCVFDLETRRAHRLVEVPGSYPVPFLRPLALSPDRTSLVRLAYDADNAPVLLVDDFVAGTASKRPIDRLRQRFAVFEELDRAWLDHHYRWSAAPGGHDTLVEREDARPLPWRGRLTVDPHDGYREYRIQPVREELLAVIVRLLQQELGGQLLPREPYATGETLRFGDRTVHLLWSDGHVGVWMDRGGDSSLVEEIGNHLDGALASGELDDYFVARVD